MHKLSCFRAWILPAPAGLPTAAALLVLHSWGKRVDNNGRWPVEFNLGPVVVEGALHVATLCTHVCTRVAKLCCV